MGMVCEMHSISGCGSPKERQVGQGTLPLMMTGWLWYNPDWKEQKATTFEKYHDIFERMGRRLQGAHKCLDDVICWNAWLLRDVYKIFISAKRSRASLHMRIAVFIAGRSQAVWQRSYPCLDDDEREKDLTRGGAWSCWKALGDNEAQPPNWEKNRNFLTLHFHKLTYLNLLK